MRAHFRQWFEDIYESFWLRPSSLVLVGIALAELMINAERSDILPAGFLADWLYSGGETGARTLLGAIAGSTIGVAGTVFSITIATLTLASSQMGPRLLHNFTRDRGNQVTLGVYLATFAYALIVLRSVRGGELGAFVPHMAITVAILLALLCVAMLIYFVNHVASRINFDTVIELAFQDLSQRLEQLTADGERPPRIEDAHWEGGLCVRHESSGYIQQVDDDLIADWAENHGASVRLNARIGNFAFPGAPLAIVVPGIADARKVIHQSLVLGAYPTGSGDLEYAVEQLVDIAVRALSSGINDPRTANRIIDRLGATLCLLAAKTLPTGAVARNGQIVFQRNTTTYDGLMDAMFHTIRQSAKGSPSVLIHILDILIKVAQCEADPIRREAVRRHAGLVMEDGDRDIAGDGDRKSLRERFNLLRDTMMTCPPGDVTADVAAAGEPRPSR